MRALILVIVTLFVGFSSTSFAQESDMCDGSVDQPENPLFEDLEVETCGLTARQCCAKSSWCYLLSGSDFEKMAECARKGAACLRNGCWD